MKNAKFYITVVTIATVMISCKDEKKEQADKAVSSYETYVDSISKVAPNDALGNWETIETSVNNKKTEAETALTDVKDKTAYETKIAASSEKYEVFKASLIAEKQKSETANYKTTIRKALFGVEIGDDMNFDWVNKDNILKVYDNFVTTVSNNKDSYSREDWDEIKLLYEALDAHKNTVEKNGLTPEDNRKIAGLKIKFAPMLKINRMSAKSEENAKAKE
ncbi:hypothetical protein FCR2A7T_07600 [Flavobacterium cauense R2A-7]|uniref:Lipoprotein n=1 Tax=Flavobacterium cauense R2A-7 TaxID=1341154 RepID=V6S2T4_9FLAO|nr:hypothetical protein [Flavobacterium cauense]ESU20988.1 hypothetical protein FCR2A7T_07600 [Flavobacterium cauense R2A-7]KGO79597.1 hypothetical protein Q762_13945 [Flavobacterium cauense R2A-7]TWI08344.1 hypothetical protein IP98_02764 [Flavobacterium cauense R2A-7]